MTTDKKCLINWVGGKRLLRKTIAPLIPTDIKSYIEPFGGGAWVTIQDQFRFKIGYKAGMLNTCKTDNVTVKNNVLSVSVGYIF